MFNDAEEREKEKARERRKNVRVNIEKTKGNREKVIWDECGCMIRAWRHVLIVTQRGSRGNEKIIVVTMKFRNFVERITSRGVAAFISCATPLIKRVNCSGRHAEKTA